MMGGARKEKGSNDTTLVFFVGGFLGAGKTTAIGAMGEILRSRGEKVAAVTNDQTDQLVDTACL